MTAPRPNPFGGCGCDNSAGVRLDVPVYDVTEVIVGGEVLDPSEYMLENGMWLHRILGSWPIGGGDPADESFVITYQRGVEVPSLVRRAMVELVNELWKDDCGNRGCVIGPAVSSMNTGGTSYSYPDRAERVKESGSALPTVFKARTAYNPGGQPFPAYIWSPDDPYRNRTVRTFP